MDDGDDIPTPLDSMTDALVGSGFVVGRIIGHMMASQAVTGRTEPPIPDALHTVLRGVIEPMAESRAFELGVAARVLHDVLELVMEEVHLMPVELPAPPRRSRVRRKRR